MNKDGVADKLHIGKIIEIGSINDIFNSPRHPYTYILLKVIPILYPIYKNDFKIPETDVVDALNPLSGCLFHQKCPFVQEICIQKTAVLEKASKTYNVASHFQKDLTIIEKVKLFT